MAKYVNKPNIIWEASEASWSILSRYAKEIEAIRQYVIGLRERVEVPDSYLGDTQGLVSRCFNLLPDAFISKSRSLAYFKMLVQYKNIGPSFSARLVKFRGDISDCYLLKPASIGFRGSFIHASDLADGFQGLAEFPGGEGVTSEYSWLQNLVVLRETIPFGLLTVDAMDEAVTAQELHSAYAMRFGELANVPFPLAVISWGKEDVEKVSTDLLPYLSQRERAEAREIFEGGLATLVYFMPNPSLRVSSISFNSLVGPYQPEGFEARKSFLSKIGVHPQRFLESLCENVLRIFSLGWMPVDRAATLDQPLSSYHVAVDGSLLSVKSFRLLTEVIDPVDFRESLFIVVLEIANSMRDLALRPLDYIQNFRQSMADRAFQADFSMILGVVWSTLYARLQQLKHEGHIVDPRIESFFINQSFQELEYDLETIYPRMDAGVWSGMNGVWK